MSSPSFHHAGHSGEPFLRSINVSLDAQFPERIRHFRPTAKCVPLLRALLGLERERAFFLVAPYGSGKSLAAAYAGHLVENSNRSAEVRAEIQDRLTLASPGLATEVYKRHTQQRRGLAIVLHGHVANLAEYLVQAAADSFKRIGIKRPRTLQYRQGDNVADTINVIRELCCEHNGDRVTIVWDEFGRHLEALVAEGRGDELSEIQVLAEISARTPSLPITFCVILHQGLSQYATGLPQAIRTDWRKIEGRFETVQYVDDSKEIYRLIAEVVQSRAKCPHSDNLDFKEVALSAKRNQLFSELGVAELADLLRTAYPLEPAALYLLPRVSARVAQNERTLFSFLYHCDTDLPVTVGDLYDYFSPTMRADTAVGGTYRQWLETESAISKVPDDSLAIKTLKTACLLGFGTSGSRARTGIDLLKFAIGGFSQRTSSTECLNALVKRKLLLHRVHNDDVSVWHGTDTDLRGRLDEELKKIGPEFDLVGFLNKEAPPPIWKPVQYNDDNYIRRYLIGSYADQSRFPTLSAWAMTEVPKDSDGEIVFLLADDDDELTAARKIASSFDDERVLLAVPKSPIPLRDAAAEVHALQVMQRDKELIESDPIALAELHQMADDAFEHLQKQVDRLVTPAADGPVWIYRGEDLEASSPTELRQRLSELMRRVFPDTPLINNEMINRKKPTPALVNARKKLTLAILERHGQERLGLDGFFPDRSMFNTVLSNTGLYAKDKAAERWGYIHDRFVRDPGLREVWKTLREFLTDPSDLPKTFSGLIDRLQMPPIGLRMGVIPILVAASLRAFPSAISIMHRGKYLNDILPSDIESICKAPDEYQVLVLDVDHDRQTLLRGIYKRLSSSANYEIEENDLVRHSYDALEAWKHHLPPAAFTTGRLTKTTDAFRAAIVRVHDPVQLFFDEIPRALNPISSDPNELLGLIDVAASELENVAMAYTRQAIRIVQAALSVGGGDGRDVRDVARLWASYFAAEFVEQLSDGVAKGLLSRMALEYESESLLIDSLASLLVKKSVRRWDDSMAAAFDREFTSYVTKVENAARSYPVRTASEGGLSRLVLGRMQQMYRQLAELVGDKQAAEMLQEVMQESRVK